MATVLPFKAARPRKDIVDKVVTRNYGGYNHEEIASLIRSNKFSFVQVVNTKIDTPELSRTDRYKFVKNKYLEFSREFLVKDPEPCYYIYEQATDGHLYYGLIALASVEDYDNGTIKKHESTLPAREQKLAEYLNIVDINAEPVCLTYEGTGFLKTAYKNVQDKQPMYQFSTDDGSKHKMWRVFDRTDVNLLSSGFEQIDHIYILDGHHRCSCSSLLNQQLKGKDTGGGQAFFMAFFIPEEQLSIYEYNRGIRNIGAIDEGALLEKLSAAFEIEKLDNDQFYPARPKNYILYTRFGKFRLVTKSATFDQENPVDSLDTSILNDNFLNPILGITDLKKDERVVFGGGKGSMEKLCKKVDVGKLDMAISLYPISINELKKVADTGNIMPPKSTWIEPKLLNALTIYELNLE